MAGLFPFRLVTWDDVDAAMTAALSRGTASTTYRMIQGLVATNGGGGGSGGMSSADKSVVPAVRRRSAANEAAPTASNWDPRPTGYGAVFAIGALPAPDDAIPGDLHILPPPSAANTVTTSFALADGSAWPTPWVAARVPAGGGATVTEGMGVLRSGSVGGYSSADAAAMRYGDAASDIEVVFTFRLTSAEPYVSLVLRSDNASLDPGSGVVVGINKTSLKAASVASFTYTPVGVTAAKTFTQDSDYRCHAVCSGGSLMVRTWPLAAPEPDTWDVSGTVPTGVTGYQGLVIGSGKNAVAQSAAFDDIVFTSGASGYGTSYGLAYGIS